MEAPLPLLVPLPTPLPLPALPELPEPEEPPSAVFFGVSLDPPHAASAKTNDAAKSDLAFMPPKIVDALNRLTLYPCSR